MKKALDILFYGIGFVSISLALITFLGIAGYVSFQTFLKPLLLLNASSIAIGLTILAVSLLIFGKLLWMFIKKVAIVGAVLGGILLIFKGSSKVLSK
jgi:hypothetical protein